MSLFNILAPSETDQKYTSNLISSINVYNLEDNCNSISQILQTSKEISRKTMLPLKDIALKFMTEGKFEFASTIIFVFIRAPTLYLKASDLKKIVEFSVKSQNVQNSSLLETILVLCTRTIITKDDLTDLIDNTNDLVCFATKASNQNILKFIAKIVSLDPSLRVPFVFSGLIEQLLPTIAQNKQNCRVLSSLVSDTQSRKYFVEMGHMSQLITILFDTEVSTPVTSIFRSLLSTDDLTHLRTIQTDLFAKDVPKQLLFVLFHSNNSDESLSNAAILVGDIIQYYPLQQIPFDYKEFLDLAAKKPNLRIALLYMLESFCLANSDLKPNESLSIEHTDLQNDMFFALFCAYLCHDSSKREAIDFTKFAELKGRQLCFALIFATECRVAFPSAEVLSQSQENESVAQLASINCLVCQHFQERLRAQMVQNAVTFFANEHETNVGTYQPLFFPRAFLDWGMSEFCEASLPRWMLSSTHWSISQTNDLFDREPDDTADNVIRMFNMINTTRKEITELEEKKSRLLEEAEEAERKRGEAEMELIEARCRMQLSK